MDIFSVDPFWLVFAVGGTIAFAIGVCAVCLGVWLAQKCIVFLEGYDVWKAKRFNDRLRLRQQ